MISMKVLIKDGLLEQKDIQFFLKAGSALEDRNNLFNWMEHKAFLNLKALIAHKFGTQHGCFFKELSDRISRNEQIWRSWYGEDEPEEREVPDYNDKIKSEQIGHFINLCLIRCVREDRTKLAADKFIEEVLGAKYVRPVADGIPDLFEETRNNVPVLYLLSPGADPTNMIDEFAKKKKKYPCEQISMGEEQEKLAKSKINIGYDKGTWVILQNCHLGLEFMGEIEEILHPKERVIHDEFRLWITCEPHQSFPLSLLQLAIKVTTEPPKGI